MQRRDVIAGLATLAGGCAIGAKAQTYPDIPRDRDPIALHSGEPLFTQGDLAANAIGREFGVIPHLRQPVRIGYDAGDSKPNFTDLTGKIRLLALWADWASSSLYVLPELAVLQQKYGGDSFEILAIMSGSDPSLGFKEARGLLDLTGADNLPLWVETFGGKKTLAMAHPVPAKAFPTESGEPLLPCMLLVDETATVRGRMIGVLSAPLGTDTATPSAPAPDGGKLTVTESHHPAAWVAPSEPSIWTTPAADAFITALIGGGLASAAA